MSNLGDEEDALVPCEFCDQMVRFSQYNEHANSCAVRTHMMPPSFIVYRDDDDNAVYQIDIRPAIRAFNMLQFTLSNNIESDQIVNMPRIIPMMPEFVEDDGGSYEYNELISEYLGPVRVGLSNPKYLPIPEEACNSGEICPICQEDISDADVVMTLCKHVYCHSCISKWFKEHVTCPVCNADQRDISEG